jgi:hypothetical protein
MLKELCSGRRTGLRWCGHRMQLSIAVIKFPERSSLYKTQENIYAYVQNNKLIYVGGGEGGHYHEDLNTTIQHNEPNGICSLCWWPDPAAVHPKCGDAAHSQAASVPDKYHRLIKGGGAGSGSDPCPLSTHVYPNHYSRDLDPNCSQTHGPI